MKSDYKSLRKFKKIISSLSLIGFCVPLFCACYVAEARVIYITATPSEFARSTLATPVSVSSGQIEIATLPPLPTLDPTKVVPLEQSEYVVQVGDTLSDIANRFNTSISTLIRLNQLANPDILYVGQILKLPGPPLLVSPAIKTLPDGALIRGPDSGLFNIEEFISQQTGYLKEYYERWVYGAASGGVITETRRAAQIIASVSLEYSIDARVLLALLEYQGEWLSDPFPVAERLSQPIAVGSAFPSGLYHQLSWSANQLNYGYYGWRYGTLKSIDSYSGERYQLSPGLNAASAAIQALFSRIHPTAIWERDVSSEGFLKIYREYFGDPFSFASDIVYSGHLKQPSLTLPFASGETWYFTGGPHNGWGSNSTWGALDFAPPDAGQHFSSCFVSQFPVLAVADGMVVHSDSGLVLLDLDQDGDPGTGWLMVYLHISSEERVKEGVTLSTGEIIGYPSCEGGYSSATHLHIARRYNGEWLPADCLNCPENLDIPPFDLGGWQAVSVQYREYQGRLVRGDEERVAEQGRNNPINQISW